MREVLAIERQIFPEDAWTEQMFAERAWRAGHAVLHRGRGGRDDRRIRGPPRRHGGSHGDVQTIAVRADRQGEGIGTALLTDLIATAAARKCREIFLDVRADNERARLLYRRTGFTEVGMRPGYYQPSGADAIVMRLRIPRRRAPGKAGTR